MKGAAKVLFTCVLYAAPSGISLASHAAVQPAVPRSVPPQKAVRSAKHTPAPPRSKAKLQNPIHIEIQAVRCSDADSTEAVTFAIDVVGSAEERQRISEHQARLSIMYEPDIRLDSAELGPGRVLAEPTESELTPSQTIPEDGTQYLDRTLLNRPLGELSGMPLGVTLRRTGRSWGKRMALVLDVENTGRTFAWIPQCGTVAAPPPAVEQTHSTQIPSTEIASPDIPHGASGTVDITWTVSFTDDAGANRPLRFASVELWDYDVFSPDDLMWSGVTDASGRLSVTGITNSDESGGLDIYLKIFAANSAVTVGDNSGTGYSWTTVRFDNITDGSHSYTTTIPTTSSSGACNIFDAVTYGWQYVTTFASAPSAASIRWPCVGCTSQTSGTVVYIEGGSQNTSDPDEWDESVILHEYGHVLDNLYAGGFTPNYHGDGHQWGSHEDQATGWGEGWGDFFQSPARRFGGYPSSDHYLDWNTSGGIDHNLETSWEHPGTGDTDVEGAVATALWDIFDSANDSGDTLSAGISPIWTVFDAGTGSDTIASFWQLWSSRNLGSLPQLSEIFWQHGLYDAVSDSSSPTATITGPTSNPTYTTSSSPVALSGSASDNLNVSRVECVNGASGTTVTASGTTNWSCSMNLLSGSNSITVRAFDRKQNVGTDSVSVTYTPPDAVNPTATITGPTSNPTYSTSTSPISLGGTASDNVGVTQVTCTNSATGSTVTATGTTNWSCSVALISGSNTITVTARDAANNQGTDTIAVTYTPPDTTSPTIIITSPTSNPTYSTTTTPITLAGSASDNFGVTQVTCTNSATGTTVTANGTTNWSCSVVLVSGNNIVTTTARDAANNQGSDTITVSYTPSDTSPPTATITSPTSNPTYTTSATPISLGGTASDNSSVTQVTCTNSATGTTVVASGTASWSCSVALIAGSNAITVIARDAANNSGSAAITVTYSPPTNPVPSISSVSPVNVTAGGPAFTLTVDGSGFIASSVVNWNGSARQTNFLSATRITALINSGDIATQGSAAVTVFNPAPGGGTSNGASVVIQPPAGQCSPIGIASCPYSINRSLTSGSCTDGKRGAGFYSDIFSFQGGSGMLVVVDLSSNAFDTYLYLVRPDGTIAAFNDDSNNTTNSHIEAFLDTSGTWAIHATTYDSGATGSYTLSLSGCSLPPATPTGLLVTYNHALFNGNPGVNASWQSVSGAVDYEADVNGYVLDLQSSTPSAAIYGLSEPVCYAIRVRAINASGQRSGWSARDIATSIVFTDDPLVVAGTPVKAAHHNELRAAVATVRAAAGLSSAIFTDSISTGTIIRARHLTETRDALNEALTTLGIPPVSFATPTSAVTRIDAMPLRLLRDAMK